MTFQTQILFIWTLPCPAESRYMVENQGFWGRMSDLKQGVCDGQFNPFGKIRFRQTMMERRFSDGQREKSGGKGS